ncbi:hypothetical protein ANCCAN_14802 [Ancylostoma caninum]|uniref:Uncharacterized protein n=1 Tax=Ancylostoma caninum TaxID=29170 RepID=A0A368G4A0_ANCCA|nr:hypothetical protein ANCCAN_14802 [Ancylostoma caninum]
MSLQPCFLCGAHRTLVSVHNVTDSDRAFNLILLSILTRYKVTTLENALGVYKASHSKAVRICRYHFTQAASYIGSQAEQLWPELSTNGLCGAPSSVMDALLTHIRMYATKLDDKMELNANNLLSFYNKLVTGHGTNGNLVPLQKDASSNTLCNQKPSTSTGNSPAPAAGFREREMVSSKAPEERSLSPEEISAESLLEQSDFLATSSVKLECSFCKVRYLERGLTNISDNAEQNAILLSCLVMDNTIESNAAVRIWKEICGSSKMVCKQHYVHAVSFYYEPRLAWSLGEEVRQMWKKYPVHGLHQVPAHMQENLLRRVQASTKMFDKHIKLSLKDLWSFYDFCKSFYACGSESEMNSHVTVGNSEKPLLKTLTKSTVKQSSKQTPEVSDGAAKQQSSSRSKVDKPSSDDGIHEDELERRIIPSNITCRICYRACPDVQSRISSRYRDQNIVFLSCLVLCGEVDMEQAKETYLQILLGRKRFCQRHYIRAVSLSTTLP